MEDQFAILIIHEDLKDFNIEKIKYRILI